VNAHTMDHTFGSGATAPAPHDQAIGRTCAALWEHGLCVLDGIDVRELLKEGFNPRFHPYLILSMCDRAVARRAFPNDPEHMQSLCNVVVYDNGDGTSTVETLITPASLGLPGDDPAIVSSVQEAASGLRGAVDSFNRSEERRERA
jgi:uncharacterized protein (DUF302 family)